jgi:basic membrane protein A
MMKKRYLALLLVLVLALVACNPEATGDATEAPATVAGEAEVTEAADTGDTEATEETEGDETEPAGEGTGSDLKVGMVTDEGGVNDQSFNQSAWEGMERAEEELGVGVSYVESHNESDYAPNFDTSLEQGNQLIWGIGFMLTDALNAAAEANPETNYALVDSVAAEGLNNAVSVLFKAEQPSFLVGYIAAHMTESNNVGFIGGVEGDIIWGFEYGYRAGVAYGAKELGKEIEVQVQYANSFTDSAIGKAIAKTMYGNGADIIFSAAGDVGTGAIEESREAHTEEKPAYAIGVDRDQNYLSPETVITSAVKRVDVGVYNVIKETVENGFPGGQVFTYGLQDGGAVDIAETSDQHVPAEVLEKIDPLKEQIINEEIVVPFTAETFETWLAEQ